MAPATSDDALDAAVSVLRDARGPLHWTVIQDRALRAGHLDPFTTPNVRRELLTALRRGVQEGVLRVADTGVYELAVPTTDS
ncbi:MAG: hypothetical protein ACXWW9_00500 [Actinomycetota bacterium]